MVTMTERRRGESAVIAVIWRRLTTTACTCVICVASCDEMPRYTRALCSGYVPVDNVQTQLPPPSPSVLARSHGKVETGWGLYITTNCNEHMLCNMDIIFTSRFCLLSSSCCSCV
ncbi:hypothetical protein BDW22DRAFT_430271 [Trametopsis cervina]|nr:hypothetical protein BDW22DRAFT_430271 [Trametopsis cervina]